MKSFFLLLVCNMAVNIVVGERSYWKINITGTLLMNAVKIWDLWIG